MPDFAVASSKRIVLGAPACGACANKEEDRKKSPRNLLITLVSSRGVLRGRARHISRRRGLEQDHGNRILRRGFRSGMAPDTSTLLAATHPEESRFALQGHAGAIQQFDLQRFLGWHLNEE